MSETMPSDNDPLLSLLVSGGNMHVGASLELVAACPRKPPAMDCWRKLGQFVKSTVRQSLMDTSPVLLMAHTLQRWGC